jgi:hypothetical protein
MYEYKPKKLVSNEKNLGGEPRFLREDICAWKKVTTE